MKPTRSGHPTAERAATDKTLRAERQRTDDELARTHAEHDKEVDRTVADVRARANRAVVSEGEASHDDEAQPTARERGRSATVDERGFAGGLERERAQEDEHLASQRAALNRDIATLLDRERDETDERLLLERIRADAVVGSRDDFLAIVSHDLRAMLSGISMNLALLTRLATDRGTKETITAASSRIERVIARMNRLIGDLLDVSRIDAGVLEIILAPGDPAELVEEAVDGARLLAEAKGITLTAHTPTYPIRAMYDRERMLQVLGNLIGNALKFTTAGGRVDVSVEGDAAEVRFTVADTGRGIPERELAAIFERFAQGERRDRSGLGLGLYIARRICEGHGGRVWVESRPHEGSAFHCVLPAVPYRAPRANS